MIVEVTKDKGKYDIFKFRQEQHGAVKAIVYGAAAFFTIGLSELITCTSYDLI